ncbi:hypothetical protein [Streptomyces sp. NPDC057302]|uniref:hypothetical protein n=1 Tax=Streptomyces sp. NPDC057302 TaxID=3346094 RepID=UPI00362D3C3D
MSPQLTGTAFAFPAVNDDKAQLFVDTLTELVEAHAGATGFTVLRRWASSVAGMAVEV